MTSKKKSDVNSSLYYLNAQVEMLDLILKSGGQITIKRIERLKRENLEKIQELIRTNCS
jgi:hypothetical protein